MNTEVNTVADLHWLMDMLQNIDIGLVVIDRDYKIGVWNSFMENHSGRSASQSKDRNLFELFPDLPEEWFKRKAETVFLLNNRAFITWEQQDYLFRFRNYRPITGSAAFMYQNVTLIPLLSLDGNVNHVGIIVYDVTDIATNKLRLEEANRQLQSLSRTDALTQLNNRGYWEECLQHEYRRALRTGETVSLVIFDIDHFKKVNDTYGHQAGDEVIRNTSGALTQSIRSTDISGRYGGEEFVVILVDTSARDALIFTERFRERIQASVVQHEGREIRYTISLGIAQLNAGMKSPSQWLEAADNALYTAKESGRNQSVIYEEESVPETTH